MSAYTEVKYMPCYCWQQRQRFGKHCDGGYAIQSHTRNSFVSGRDVPGFIISAKRVGSNERGGASVSPLAILNILNFRLYVIGDLPLFHIIRFNF